MFQRRPDRAAVGRDTETAWAHCSSSTQKTIHYHYIDREMRSSGEQNTRIVFRRIYREFPLASVFERE